MSINLERMTQENLEIIYTKLCIFSYMFKLQSPSKYSLFDAVHLWRHFSTAQNLSILMCFSAAATFCFTSSTLAKCFPLRSLLIRETKKATQRDWVNREGEAWGHASLGQKQLNTERGVGSCACKSSIMK